MAHKYDVGERVLRNGKPPILTVERMKPGGVHYLVVNKSEPKAEMFWVVEDEVTLAKFVN